MLASEAGPMRVDGGASMSSQVRRLALGVQWLAAAVVVAWIASRLLVQPVAAHWITLGLVVYWIVLWRWPAAWLVVIPALIPALDLTPWTGRIYLGEIDLFVALTIAEGLRRGFLTDSIRWLSSGIGPPAVAILLCTLLGVAVAWQAGVPSDASGYGYYYSPLNALREAKGVVAAFLLYLLLGLELSQRRPVAVLLTTGMLLGLLVAGSTIVWERFVFTGLFSFGRVYEHTGLFSYMHVGGASVDGYLALTFPFVAVLFASARGRWMWLGALLLFALGLYSFTVTFSRANLLVVLVMVMLAWIGQRYLHRGKRAPSGQGLKWVISGVLIASMIAAPIVAGVFVQVWPSTLARDAGTRFQHWGHVVQTIGDGAGQWAFGVGGGGFPRAYRDWLWSQGHVLPQISRRGEGGNHFMRYSHSDPADQQFLTQRIEGAGSGNAVLSIRMRGHGEKPDKLLVEFCSMNILRAPLACRWIGIRLDAAAPGEWATYTRSIDLGGLGNGLLGLPRTVQLLLLNRGLKNPIDIDNVRLTASGGRALIDNGGFESGLDHWLRNAGDYRQWHAQNIFLQVLFETGVVGLCAFVWLLMVALVRLLERIEGGDRLALVLLVSLSGFLVLGIFDSLIDDPRIALLFFLLVFVAASPVTLAMSRAPGVLLPWGRIVLALSSMLFALAVAVVTYASLTRHLPPAELIRSAIKRADIDWPLLDRVAELLAPAPRFADFQMDGRLREAHPRILLPGLADWDGRGQSELMRERVALYAANGIPSRDYLPCSGYGVLGRAACWVTTGDEAKGSKALSQLTKFILTEPRESGKYGNAWRLAWAYDLLSLHPRMDGAIRARVESTLADSLRSYLLLLDGDSASLWHGRATLAAQAWIIAVVLSPERPEYAELIRRAQSHFVDVMRALALSEGWPEGYNYWVNSRALLLVLAAAAYLNGLEDAGYAPSVRRALERVGLWTVYMTRPDGRIEAVGDEGPRVDLAEETQRVIDLIGQLTRNPVFATYSRYLRHLRGVSGYYRDYRWQFFLFNDPSVPPVPGVRSGTLNGLDHVLPPVDQFGPGAFNQVVMRSGWAADDTVITLRAGASLTHHGHYDAGHFTLFKGAPLAITNATYGGNVSAPHRLYYGVRTVSKNSLLVMRPEGTVQPSERVRLNVIDGGQRIVMPTGSAVRSVQDWLDNLDAGWHFEGGQVSQLQRVGDELILVRADLTSAYDTAAYDSQGDGGRVESVQRDFLYLVDEDRLLIHDRIRSTRPEYTKKWLLHLPRRPEIPGLRVLRGLSEAGIMQSTAAAFSMTNGAGRLDVVRIAPDDAVLRLVGGPGFAYYVETDGDDSDLDGESFDQGANPRPWFDNGRWRVEIQPWHPRKVDDFLVALTPSLTASATRPAPVSAVPIVSGDALAAASERSLIVFSRDWLRDPVSLYAPGGQDRLVLVGVIGGQEVRLSVGGRSERLQVPESGAMMVPMSMAPGEPITISADGRPGR